jgi:hypothetical protein
MQVNIFEYANANNGTETPDFNSPGTIGSINTWHGLINTLIANPDVSSIFFPNDIGYKIIGTIHITRPIELIGEINSGLNFRQFEAYNGFDNAPGDMTGKVGILIELSPPISSDIDSTEVIIKQLSCTTDSYYWYPDASANYGNTTPQDRLLHCIYNVNAQLYIERCDISQFTGTCIYNLSDNWQIIWSFVSACGMHGFYTEGSAGTAIYLHTSYCGFIDYYYTVPTPTIDNYYGIMDVSPKGNTFICAHCASVTGSFYAKNQGVWMGCYTEDAEKRPIINNGALWINQERSVPDGNGTVWTGSTVRINEGNPGFKFLNNIDPSATVHFTAGSHLPHVIFEFGAALDFVQQEFSPRIGDFGSEITNYQHLSAEMIAKMSIQYPPIYTYFKMVGKQLLLLEKRKKVTNLAKQQKIDLQIAKIEQQKRGLAKKTKFIKALFSYEKASILMKTFRAAYKTLSNLETQYQQTNDPKVLAALDLQIKQTLITIKDTYAQIKDLIGIEPIEWLSNASGIWRLRYDLEVATGQPNANDSWYKLVYETDGGIPEKYTPAILFSSGVTPLTEADHGSVAFPKGFYLGSKKTRITNSGTPPTSSVFAKIGDIIFNTNPTNDPQSVAGWMCTKIATDANNQAVYEWWPFVLS